MASFVPYTYIQCPCSEIPTSARTIDSDPIPQTEEDEEEGRNFDPSAPRANYALYPLEHLLYCEDCHQIRCPRCYLEEILTWYCPNCLFEVPSSTVKSEGNRCTRNCFNCPICTSPLAVTNLELPPTGLGAEFATPIGSYVLSCGHCTWSSKEIGVQFEKSNGIYSQLSKIKNGGGSRLTAKERRRDNRDEHRGSFTSSSPLIEEPFEPHSLELDEILDTESHFSNLLSFYKSQAADTAPSGSLGFAGDYGFGSPGALSRIMGLYAGGADKKIKTKPKPMREAVDVSEGLQILRSEDENVNRLRRGGWNYTTSLTQRREQLHNPQFVDDLRPIATLLRTKRSKRCKQCRHILSKPESKVQTTRFRIRLVAQNYVPSISIKPIQSIPPGQSSLLAPLRPTQFVLTFRNPLFDAVKVSIATPAETSGRFKSKVTILCPQFEVGANTDMWDEALREGGGGGKGGESKEKRRTKAEASEGQPQAEAGKVWEYGRNWVSVVLEVVPASLKMATDDGPLKEDEDLLEIPVFVRLEWETDVAQDEGGEGTLAPAIGKDKETPREKRELAYWCVLGIGRIAQV
ncbi:dynactin Arp1 p62 subunit RO2 [Xylogone sp. PMI_703]|nr:dynactin Arp1 p62 subunit RO2 [Xylogone sp. PMI_703]